MESLSLSISIPTRSSDHCTTQLLKPNSTSLRSSHPTRNFTPHCSNSPQNHASPTPLTGANLHGNSPKALFFSIFTGLSFPCSCFASEIAAPTEEIPSKINLEAILVSIDELLTRYPFVAFGVAFIWLAAVPLTQQYMQKYKFISAINAFKKLRDDPNYQMLDIRDKRALAYLNSPNLKLLKKSARQVHFVGGNEDAFVKEVMEKFPEPQSTNVCIIDHFDGNSITVAELLVKSGFKEAYAIRGGLRGSKGWQEIQEELLPLSVRVYPKKKAKVLELEQGNSTDAIQPDEDMDSGIKRGEEIIKGSVTMPLEINSSGYRPLSPYTNYPDLKPPSSPTPSKPSVAPVDAV
ncbi:unnamed protein product [Cuscuta epithymum]|uniref:Rhodanese domain-containing protein n=1 Tax=Cuscuta epithymum TaxID=186058 RepID=A0AAV0DY06_9ASTE|nr:unnamed protein product [Cuscuta epithymum]